jgi:predicted nucleotidyltransferase
MLGLNEEDIKTITAVISKCSEVEEAIIFGSRAKGNYRNGSDVDIVLKGGNITRDIILTISGELNEETTMPYHFDVLNFNTIRNDDLVAHIQRVGKTVYKRSLC